jgi:hypothetical protein
MKVNIGPFIQWIGPYQIAEKILFWKDKYEDDSVYKLGEILADTPLMPICEWIHSKQHRKVKIKIHRYDSWNAFETMAMVILPILEQLKKDKQGTPWTDYNDGPWYYRFIDDGEFNSDEKGSYNDKRWEWILDEMIWAFQQMQPDYDWEENYRHGNIDFNFKKCEDNPNLSQMVNGPKHTYWADYEGMKKHEAKIQNGLRLFGKYFQTLWD